MSVACIAPRRPAARVVLGGLAAGLLGAAVATVVATGAGWAWVAAAFLAPDVALLLGAGRGLAPGQLHPRAVPLYNLLHRFWLPLALGIAATAGPISTGYLAAALIWAFHVSLDRAVGYGLRTRDGYQRA